MQEFIQDIFRYPRMSLMSSLPACRIEAAAVSAQARAGHRAQKFIPAFLLQGGAPVAGVVITHNGLQWYNGAAHALAEASAEALTEGEAAQWMAGNFCAVRCSLHLHAEVMHPSRLATHIAQWSSHLMVCCLKEGFPPGCSLRVDATIDSYATLIVLPL